MKPLFIILFFVFFFSRGFSAGNITMGVPGNFLSYTEPGGTHWDTIFVNGGSYPGIGFYNVIGTDSLHPTVIIPKGSRVISNALSNDAGIELGTCRYVKVTGYGIPGVQYGFLAGAGGTGSFDAHYGSSNIEIDSVECDNSAGGYAGLIYRTYPSEGCQWSVSGGWAIYGMKIHDNYIHDASGEGMYLGCSHYGNVDANGYLPVSGNPLGGCSSGNEAPIVDAKINNNLVKNVGYDGIQLSGCISGCSITQNTIIGFAQANTDGQDGGITWNPGTLGICDRNWVQYVGNGFCMGIMYQGQGDSYISNNVIIGGGNGQVGFAMLRNTVANVNGSTHFNIFMDNNTVVGFQTGYWWYGDNGFGVNCFFRNDIITAPTIFSIGNGNIGTLQLVTTLQNTSNAFPQFVNYAANNLHLQATSPAIGAGTNIIASDPRVAVDYDGLGRVPPLAQGAFNFTSAPVLPPHMKVRLVRNNIKVQ